MLTRRQFITQSSMLALGAAMIPQALSGKANTIMTVTGPISTSQLGFTLMHEHVLADFIGAEKYSKERYNADEVYNRALPFLKEIKELGCSTFVDCSPAYLGRDVKILQRLAKATGLNIITNTGYYGAVGEKFYPKFVFSETSEQIAARWIEEWKNGIEGTGIKPAFMKTSVDNAPLTSTQRKVIDAAALTHLATGMTIGIHTGNGDAAMEEVEILKKRGVAPSASIWIHSQNEPNKQYHIKSAKAGRWISFDDVNPETIGKNVDNLKLMKTEKLLDHVIVSQDSGWYNVGEPNGGNFKSYNCIFKTFLPALKENGFTQKEIDQLFITNPAKVLELKVRKL